ncbi:MAG: glycosyltransferase [Treponema sp.]|nr:glycosyltransferase [Treponema sp.]
MKLSAVVVWFNPDEKCIENLRTYHPYVERIYVIDNSESDNSDMLAKISNIVYIPNFENKGIAVALNQGCERALSDGFDWCMTMDQDSSWEKDELGKYFTLVGENSNDSMNVSFATSAQYVVIPNVCSDIKHFLLKITGKPRIKIAGCPTYSMVSCDRVITSGNIINLFAWKKVGKFYEPFFIDEVDHEFCYRLRENGFSIIQFPQVQMNHVLGVQKKTFWQCDLNHHKKRLYYIFRNSLCLKNMHHEYFKRLNYKKHLCKICLDIFLTAHLMDFFYVVQGISDALKNRMGKYEHWHKQCLRNK